MNLKQTESSLCLVEDRAMFNIFLVLFKNVQVGNGQEMVHLERNSHSTNQGV